MAMPFLALQHETQRCMSFLRSEDNKWPSGWLEVRLLSNWVNINEISVALLRGVVFLLLCDSEEVAQEKCIIICKLNAMTCLRALGSFHV